MAPVLSHKNIPVEPGSKLGESATATSGLEAEGATEHALHSPQKEATKRYHRHNHSRIQKWTGRQAAEFANGIFGIFGLELLL